MPLDHFVSQVHLKRFGSAELGGRLYAIRKRDQKYMEPLSEDVCRIPEGSTNEYLREPRVVEDFLKLIEPKYNRSIDKLLSSEIDEESIFTISGFIAYVMVCSPTGMRLHAELLQRNLRLQVEEMEAQNLIPPAPPELGEATLGELIDSGAVEIEVDHKYPQALGITQIYEFVQVFGNSDWDLLINDHSDCPFITSDYPVGLEVAIGSPAQNKIVPLAPGLAIRIHPRWEVRFRSQDTGFQRFRHRVHRVRRSEVVAINQTLVRCAEDLVFFPVFGAWVPEFMRKHSGYRIERRQHEGKDRDGKYIIDTQVIARVER